ncbi:hypothetical protein J1N35_015235 [Gossypium stocksii]|uniref:Uncharacterized protein n=1 Tax=Gossypium stocksii TaxID=47602 RepID=A0A9D4AA56_9ROSI|nr:hypothetical protein J1N35_015235 [Gossypium stocksii]
MSWRIGRGIGILVWDDHWIPGKDTNKWSHRNDNEVKLVSDLIDTTNNMWKTDLVNCNFPADIAQKILQIPLAETSSADFQIWGRGYIPRLSALSCSSRSLANVKAFLD